MDQVTLYLEGPVLVGYNNINIISTTCMINVDIDECLDNALSSDEPLCDTTQLCVNTNGSYLCVCPPGTVMIESSCIIIG